MLTPPILNPLSIIHYNQAINWANGSLNSDLKYAPWPPEQCELRPQYYCRSLPSKTCTLFQTTARLTWTQTYLRPSWTLTLVLHSDLNANPNPNPDPNPNPNLNPDLLNTMWLRDWVSECMLLMHMAEPHLSEPFALMRSTYVCIKGIAIIP